MDMLSCENNNRDLVSRAFPPRAIEYEDANRSIIFRPFEPSDIHMFKEVLKENLAHVKKFMVWPHQDWSHIKCLEWLIKAHADYLSGKCFDWACFDKNTGEFLLSTGIMPTIPINPDCWEIGYWAVSKHINKGLSTLAAQVIIACSFKFLGVNRLQVTCLPENKASQRVIEKCGFQFEGKLRNFFPSSEGRQRHMPEMGDIDLLYSLIPKDIPNLSWYTEIVEKVRVSPISGDKTLPLSVFKD